MRPRARVPGLSPEQSPKEGLLYLTFMIFDLSKVPAAWEELKESGR